MHGDPTEIPVPPQAAPGAAQRPVPGVQALHRAIGATQQNLQAKIPQELTPNPTELTPNPKTDLIPPPSPPTSLSFSPQLNTLIAASRPSAGPTPKFTASFRLRFTAERNGEGGGGGRKGPVYRCSPLAQLRPPPRAPFSAPLSAPTQT